MNNIEDLELLSLLFYLINGYLINILLNITSNFTVFEFAMLPCQLSAFEKSIRGYAVKPTDLVINPEIGTSFDSIEEAYDFYNLCSWEVGFGIHYGKSRLNIEMEKCMQEIIYGCAVCTPSHNKIQPLHIFIVL
jgi:hypothetical protein